MEELVAEINRLHHKKKSVGLTKEEQELQDKLRRQYIDRLKNNVAVELENLVIEKNGQLES